MGISRDSRHKRRKIFITKMNVNQNLHLNVAVPGISNLFPGEMVKRRKKTTNIQSLLQMLYTFIPIHVIQESISLYTQILKLANILNTPTKFLEIWSIIWCLDPIVLQIPVTSGHL